MPIDWLDISMRLYDIQLSYGNFEDAVIALDERNIYSVDKHKELLLRIIQAIRKKEADPNANTIDENTGIDLMNYAPFLLSSNQGDLTDEEFATKLAWEASSDDRWLHSDFIPQISRATHFLSCYVAFENYLLGECESLAEKHLNSKKAFEVIKGSGVLKAKNFLKSIMDIKTFDLGIGRDINQFRLIRNSISHNGIYGCFTVEDHQAEWVDNHPHLVWVDKRAREVGFTDRFVPYVIKTIERFVELLAKDLAKHGYREEPEEFSLSNILYKVIAHMNVNTGFEKWWEKFLAKLPLKTKLHANSKVSKSNNLVQNAGYPHIDYRYLPRKNSTAVALFIDQGEKEKNQAIYQRLYQHKDEIEAAFGGPLEWNPYPESRNVKVQKRVTQVGLNQQDQWDDMIEKMIDAMIRLEKAFRPYIQKLNEPE